MGPRLAPHRPALLAIALGFLVARESLAEGSISTTVRGELATYADSDAVTVFTPAASAAVSDDSRGLGATGRYLVDVVSAASVDIVSTASPRWTEVRHAGAVSASYQPADVGGALEASASSEPDYLSLAAGGRFFFELAGNTANPFLGYSFAHDTAGRVGTPFSVFSQELARHAVSAGVELVLDGGTTFGVTADALIERGDQKKPYRLLPMFEPGGAARIPAGASLALVNQERLPGRMTERTPLTRHRFALAGRFARRFSAATVVLDDRLYADDWGLFASTVDARTIFDLGRRFVGWLHVRGHVQSGVSFWERAYEARVSSGSVVAPAYRTGDRELSPLHAGTAGAGLRWNLGADSRPYAWAVALQGDLTATRFRDAIYLRDRLGELVVLQFEATP